MSNIVAVDTSHLLYRVFYEQIGNKTRLSPKDTQEAYIKAIEELRSYKTSSTDTFIAAFDDKHSWLGS